MLARKATKTSNEDGIINFFNNIAVEGTTIYSIGSEIVIDSIIMVVNYGNEGGCLHFVNTDVVVKKSIFARN